MNASKNEGVNVLKEQKKLFTLKYKKIYDVGNDTAFAFQSDVDIIIGFSGGSMVFNKKSILKIAEKIKNER